MNYDDIEELFDQGLDRFNIDEYDEAIRIFKKVLEMNSDHPDALYYIALARANKGDYNQAIADFTKALEKDPFDTDSLIGRGEAWQSKGKVKRALADFKKALRMESDNPDYRKLVEEIAEDDIPPTLEVPEDLIVDATGIYTKVDYGEATATDESGIKAILNNMIN